MSLLDYKILTGSFSIKYKGTVYRENYIVFVSITNYNSLFSCIKLYFTILEGIFKKTISTNNQEINVEMKDTAKGVRNISFL